MEIDGGATDGGATGHGATDGSARLSPNCEIDGSARLSPNCEIDGDVRIGANSSVLAFSCIRGDLAPVTIGNGTNVQENCTIHVSIGFPVVVGDRVTIGHGAIVHGCTVADDVLVGMGSIILDGAKIGTESVVAAGALVTGGKEFPPRSMIMGSPAKVVRTLSDEDVEKLIHFSAQSYIEETAKMVKSGKLVLAGDAEGDPECR